MPLDHTRPAPLLVIAAVGAALLSLGPAVGRAQVPIVQPGAPGEPSREISATEATDLAGIRFTDGDVKFMQGMIPHHAQALEMTALVAERTDERGHAAPRAAHRALAGRRDRDDAGVAAGPRAGGHGGRRAPRRRLGADARHADRRRDGAARGGDRECVRPALPRADDRAPPGRRHDGREPPRAARGGAGLAALRVHLRRHVRPDGGDRPHGCDARRALARPPGGTRGRLRRRRAGGLEHGAGGDAREARGLLRSPPSGRQAPAGGAGPRAGGGRRRARTGRGAGGGTGGARRRTKKRKTRSGEVCSASGSPIWRSPATGCSSAATTGSTPTGSRRRRRPG